jgi:uncharacterized protein involved in exopolysaccharide biosynthesis
METDNTSDSIGQGQPEGASSPHPDPSSDAGPDPAPETDRHSIIGGLARQWRRILLAWLVVSTPLVYAIYLVVEPMYDASSLLRAEPSFVEIYDSTLSGANNPKDVKPYLLTQVQLIASDGVLDAALAKPGINNLPMIRSSRDPKADVHELMGVELVGEQTHLIRVSLVSRDPAEAAAIVNAVVDSYIDQHTTYHKRPNGALELDMETELAKLEKKIQDVKGRLMDLVDKGKVTVDRRAVPRPVKEESESIEPSFQVVTVEQYRKAADRLLQADFDLIDARARLDTAKLPGGMTAADKLRELESAVEEAKRKRIGHSQYLAKLEVSLGNDNSEQLRASILKQELAYHKRLQESVKLKLAQLEFEIGQEAYRISVHDKAAVPKVPVNNNRVKYMAITPVGILLLVLGLFLLQEVVSSRDSDTDASSDRSPRE